MKVYLKVYEYPVKRQAVILQDVASKQLSSIIISISFNRKEGLESRSDSMLLSYLGNLILFFLCRIHIEVGWNVNMCSLSTIIHILLSILLSLPYLITSLSQ